MKLEELADYEQRLDRFRALKGLRGEARDEIDQKYLVDASIFRRVEILSGLGKVEGKRILTFGDADLTGLALAVFGAPQEVVAADIDKRLSEIYFEASMEYDLPVRFLYHDMRIKMIEILRNQYSPILLEPPQTKEGVEVFISRALQCLTPGAMDELFISIPKEGDVRQFFEEYLQRVKISIKQVFQGVNMYDSDPIKTDFIQLQISPDSAPTVTHHWVRPFFESELKKEVHIFQCRCGKEFAIGHNRMYTEITALEEGGCPSCGYKGAFAYKTDIEMM